MSSSTTTQNDSAAAATTATATANANLFESLSAAMLGNGEKNNIAAPDLQQLLRGCASSVATESVGASDMNSLMAYAQQLAAVATVAQQFAAASSPASAVTSKSTATDATSSSLASRKSALKKTPHTSLKRDKMVSSSGKPTKYIGAINHELPLATKAETALNNAAVVAMFSTSSTAMNDFWASFSSMTTTATAKHNTETETVESATSSSATANIDFQKQTDVDTSDSETSSALPRECDTAERKRPAAIQELLQMKRARLSHNVGEITGDIKFSKSELADENKNDKMDVTTIKEEPKSATSPGAADVDNFSTSQQWGDGSHKEDDTETTSSYDNYSLVDQQQRLRNADTQTPTSTQKNSVEHPQMTLEDVQQLLLKGADDDDASSRAVADLLASFNSGGVASLPYLKAIQNYPTKLNGIRSPSSLKNSSTPPKSSPCRLPSRANDNDVCESPLSSLVPHDRVFAHVPGRLSLLSNVVKYKMSVGEVKRRLMGPESFNFSLLGALLRRAKMPEKSQMLVNELDEVGLSIPRGRRRLSQVTLLSALTESESIQLVKDFQRVTEAEFPAAPLAELSARRVVVQDNSTTTLRKRADQLSAALSLAHEFIEMLDQDRSPVMDTNPEPIFDRNIHDPMFTFSMLTHGFGTPAIRVGVRMLVAFLEHQQQSLRAYGKL